MFRRQAALLSLFLCLSAVPAGSIAVERGTAPVPADLVLTNAHIETMDDGDHAAASAVAIRGESLGSKLMVKAWQLSGPL